MFSRFRDYVRRVRLANARVDAWDALVEDAADRAETDEARVGQLTESAWQAAADRWDVAWAGRWDVPRHDRHPELWERRTAAVVDAERRADDLAQSSTSTAVEIDAADDETERLHQEHINTKGNTMSETTYGASVAALQQLDQKAQSCESEAQRCEQGAQGMTTSQATLDASLAKFKLDGRTRAASQRLQEATGAFERLIAEVKTDAHSLSASTKAALEAVGQHRQLAQAVQEHGEAAQMDWYRGGR